MNHRRPVALLQLTSKPERSAETRPTALFKSRSAQSAGPGHQEHYGQSEKGKPMNHKWKRDKRHRQTGNRKSFQSKRTSGKRTSIPKAKQRHQNGTHEPKIGPKKGENGTMWAQKWSQEGPKRVQKRSQTTSRTRKRIKTPPRLSWDPLPGSRPPLFGHF